MNFATKLKTYRHMLNLTQNSVADAMGVDRSTYAYYETGKSLPTSEGLRLLSKIFAVPVSYLIPPPVEAPAAPMQSNRLLLSDSAMDIPFLKDDYPPKEKSIINDDFATLSPDEKELIARYRLIKATKEEKKKALTEDEYNTFIFRYGHNL